MYSDEKFCYPDIRSEAASLSKGRDGDRIVINVGGYKHETHLSTLRNFPDTRLSWMAENPSTKGCHSPDDGNPVEYFFDRHPGVFVHILNYYRTGKLHCPSDVCGPLFEEELNFWGIDELQMEPCCWSTYTRHRDARAFEKAFTVNQTRQEDDLSEDGEPSNMGSAKQRKLWYNSYRKRIWDMLEKPYSSKGAQILALVSLMVIITSVVTFCLESIPELKSYKVFQTLDYAYCSVFTLDFAARLWSCPNIKGFFRSTLTWCDIMSVIPFYTNMIWKVNYLNVVLVVRLFRIFRLFRFFRFMSGMQVIGHTLKASARELFLLVLILLIPMVIFSSLLFYTEKAFDGDPHFYSIPHCFWWAVITMTTVGYGDIYPQTALGRVIGTMCALSGVLIIALPVSVIGSNFSLFYSHAQAQLKLPCKRKQPALVGAASVLMSAMEQETPSLLETDSEIESETGPEQNLSRTSKSFLAKGSERNVHLEVESTELRCKNLSEKEKYWQSGYEVDSSFNFECKHKENPFENREIGLERGLRAMGDIMLNIAAPAQRRMAIAGVSVAHSPALRRSNSGKRRLRSKSGDSLRKRENTSGPEICRNQGSQRSSLDQHVHNSPERSAEEITDEAADDVFTARCHLPKSDSFPGVQSEIYGKHKRIRISGYEPIFSSDCPRNFGAESANKEQLERTNGSAAIKSHKPTSKGVRENELGTYEGLELHEEQTDGTEKLSDVIVKEQNASKTDINPLKSGAMSHTNNDSMGLTDQNKLSPWSKKTHAESNETTFPRFTRRRSATINICNV